MMGGTHRTDHIPATHLRDKWGLDSIASITRTDRLRWEGHILRVQKDPQSTSNLMRIPYRIVGATLTRDPARSARRGRTLTW
jgi:hypothetical protein